MKRVFIALAALLIASAAAGESYYADITVKLEDNGFASIKGTANHPRGVFKGQGFQEGSSQQDILP